MMKKYFICLFFFISLTAQAVEPIFPDPKVPMISPEEQRAAETSLKSRRVVAKKILKMYAEAYNTEFRMKNSLMIDPIHPDTILEVMKLTDAASDSDLKKPPQETLKNVKKQFDMYAKSAFDRARAETANQIKFLGASAEDIAAMRQKLAQEQSKNIELTNLVLKLQTEVADLKKAAALEAVKAVAANAPPVAVERPPVIAPAPEPKSNPLKIGIVIFVILGLGFLFIKSKNS